MRGAHSFVLASTHVEIEVTTLRAEVTHLTALLRLTRVEAGPPGCVSWEVSKHALQLAGTMVPAGTRASRLLDAPVHR